MELKGKKSRKQIDGCEKDKRPTIEKLKKRNNDNCN